jgi:hypothetical protein
LRAHFPKIFLIMALSDRGKIEYAKKRLRRNFTGADLTSGVLEVGKVYQISAFVTGDDFKNVGAHSNASGDVFKATATTPTTWTNGSTLNEIALTAMKADADKTFDAATTTVTLTNSNFEGGQQSGEITFDKVLLGQALEELIAEFDPNYVSPIAIPRKPLGAVVRLGYWPSNPGF